MNDCWQEDAPDLKKVGDYVEYQETNYTWGTDPTGGEGGKAETNDASTRNSAFL